MPNFKNYKVTFEELNLNKPLLKALADLEYIYPTPIQKETFSVVMSGRDVVGIAQTGTGKTFAYLLPMLNQLKFSDQKDPRVLILVPTRELVLQIVEEIKKLTLYSNIRTVGFYGGTNINTQKQLAHDGMDIIVATPGRLLDLAFTGILRLKFIQKLVIDEVDEMLTLGFRSQLTSLLEIIPKKRQNLMFSATLSPKVEALVDDFFNTPQKIEIAAHGTPLDKIIQKAYYVPNFNTKVNLLEELLSAQDEYSKVLVFVSTKKYADRLFEFTEGKLADQVSVIHSGKTQSHRINIVKKFDEGNLRVLIATDIIARGMDITDVTHVINFEMPDTAGDYIHRIGRTGRADKDGIAISFISEAEKVYQLEIEQLMKKPIPIESLPQGVAISNVYMEEEKPGILYDKNYLKSPSIKGSKGAYHEKKEKNLKVNLGGPKIRNPKYGKPLRQKLTKKSAKTRF